MNLFRGVVGVILGFLLRPVSQGVILTKLSGEGTTTLLLLGLGEGPDGVVFGKYFFVEAGGAEFEAVVGDGVNMDGDTPAIDDHFFLVEDVGVGRDEGGFVVVLAAEEVGEVFVDGILAGVATFQEKEDVGEVVVEEFDIFFSVGGK